MLPHPLSEAKNTAEHNIAPQECAREIHPVRFPAISEFPNDLDRSQP